MSRVKNILFAMVSVCGIALLIMAMFSDSWEMGTTGLLALIYSQLNDIENKLDKKDS